MNSCNGGAGLFGVIPRKGARTHLGPLSMRFLMRQDNLFENNESFINPRQTRNVGINRNYKDDLLDGQLCWQFYCKEYTNPMRGAKTY